MSNHENGRSVDDSALSAEALRPGSGQAPFDPSTGLRAQHRLRPFDWAQGRLGSGPVKWLIVVRLLVAFLFLGSAATLAIWKDPPFAFTPLFVIVACTCFLSVLYLLLLRHTRQTTLLCGFQLWIDSLLVTALVHYTGGVESLFAFVYLFPILGAAILLSRRSSLLMAGSSSILYGALINAQLHGLLGKTASALESSSAHDPGYALFQSFINTVAFFLVALLGSQLAERLKEAGRELEEHRTDLRNLRTLHQDILENIPSGIITLDLKGRIVSCNRGAQKILGLAADVMRDKIWRDTPFRTITQLEAFFVAPTAAMGGLSEELEIQGQDGRSILIGMNFSPLKAAHGEIVGVVGIFQDLTERKKIEARLRQADRLAAVGRLAAGLAHEVRNPLAAISGSIQLMKEDGAARPQLLDIVLREADRLKLVTGHFLDFARPRLARERRCDLGAVVEEAVSLLEKSCEGGGPVAFSFRNEVGPVIVAADPDQLKQVFWNLGLNAIQAMPAGGQLSLQIQQHVSENGGGWAMVEFSDTGRGILPEEVDRIFDPFYTTRPDGTGLGLAIVKKIIDNLGGRIEVVSVVGQGATFKVFLKLAELSSAGLTP